jgi:hypothetical protein
MEDGNFWHFGGVTRWNSQFLIHTRTFLAIIYVASQLFLCLFWISLWLRIGVYNAFASKICVKLLKNPKIQIPTPNTSFGFANTFMMFTPCSFHSQVTNSLILSWIGVSTLVSYQMMQNHFELTRDPKPPPSANGPQRWLWRMQSSGHAWRKLSQQHQKSTKSRLHPGDWWMPCDSGELPVALHWRFSL